MSAWIVGRETIDRMMTLLVQRGEVSEGRASEVGRALWAMNVDAVSQRYSHLAHEDGDEWAAAREDAAVYEWTPSEDETVQLYKAAVCWRYQCSEGDVPERELFRLMNRALDAKELRALDETPEYDEAEWG